MCTRWWTLVGVGTFAKDVKFEWWRRDWDPLPLPPSLRGGIRRFSGSETIVFSLTWRGHRVIGRVRSILVARAEEQTVWCTDRTLRASGRVRNKASLVASLHYSNLTSPMQRYMGLNLVRWRPTETRFTTKHGSMDVGYRGWTHMWQVSLTF
jgi:hypothetical protein